MNSLPEKRRADAFFRERLLANGTVLASQINGRQVTLSQISHQLELPLAEIQRVFPTDESFRTELGNRMTEQLFDHVADQLASLDDARPSPTGSGHSPAPTTVSQPRAGSTSPRSVP
ncbi:hypothetical protein [Corynebacterium epidermidicanis]|uniref:Uncharacterized protein n=1 Tax=Corynebacterium epidermidicanis TaxID=1050174 RepID=A0A0G3GVR8_9CORY|nr:hypothetical protein [Corynebacterium epidermidicanis]AKK02972.1 hypothetical protein CEPID_05530 [Corynebacterium epidermidicanis]